MKGFMVLDVNIVNEREQILFGQKLIVSETIYLNNQTHIMDYLAEIKFNNQYTNITIYSENMSKLLMNGAWGYDFLRDSQELQNVLQNECKTLEQRKFVKELLNSHKELKPILYKELFKYVS